MGEWHQQTRLMVKNTKTWGDSDIKQEVTQHGSLIPRSLPWSFLCRMRGCDGARWSLFHNYRKICSILVSSCLTIVEILATYVPAHQEQVHVQNGPCASLSIDCQPACWEGQFRRSIPSRPQACLRSRPAHLFPCYLEPSFKQFAARYFDLLPEDFGHIFFL